jgi:hypothetical protein
MLAVLSKHLTKPEVGFNDTIISFSTYMISNIFVLIVALSYWQTNSFSTYLFWIGFVASSLDTVGMVGLTKAYATGPSGPIAAICSICNIGLVLIEAIKHWRWLSNLETIGVLIGIFGSCMLVMPEEMEQYLLCCLFQKKLKKKKVDAMVKAAGTD